MRAQSVRGWRRITPKPSCTHGSEGTPRPLTISNQLGWSDTVLWNPFGNDGMGYDSFVCVESAQAATPVILQPGEYWTGAMKVVP